MSESGLSRRNLFTSGAGAGAAFAAALAGAAADPLFAGVSPAAAPGGPSGLPAPGSTLSRSTTRPWPGLAPDQLASPGDLQVTTDFRTVVAEIVDRRLLNSNLAAVFPGFQAPAYLGIVQPAD